MRDGVSLELFTRRGEAAKESSLLSTLTSALGLVHAAAEFSVPDSRFFFFFERRADLLKKKDGILCYLNLNSKRISHL
jgi:hypothetical protein